MKNKRARSVKQEVEEPDEDEHQCVFQATATQARFGVDFNITFKCEIGGDKCEFRRRVGEDLNCDSASLRFVDGPPSFLENLTNFSWKTSNQLWLKVPREYLNKIIHTLKKKSQSQSSTLTSGDAFHCFRTHQIPVFHLCAVV